MKQKICLVVQRYGLEVNGGAELQCRQMAEQLIHRYDVTVLTTKAIDYITWKDVYTCSEEVLNGVTVKRFGVDMARDMDYFHPINWRAMQKEIHTMEDSLEWCHQQGPVCTELLDWLQKNSDSFQAVLFFTYLYYQTVHGIPMLQKKALLVPEAHDEPFLSMPIYKDVFEKPGAIFYNTTEERALVESRFSTAHIPNDIGGAGVEIPAVVDPKAFRKKFNLDTPYIVYVGRIDIGKGCDEMFSFWQRYKESHPCNTKLVLMGKPVIPIPVQDDILSLGFISDEDKFAGIAGAEFLWLHSKFESLSIVVLEAMCLEIPVLVNGICEVLKAHCVKSNAGLYYTDYPQFQAAAHYLFSHKEICHAMGKNGVQYVEQNYRWPIIMDKLSALIDQI